MRLNELFDIRNGVATTELNLSSDWFAGSIPFLRPASSQQRTLSGFLNRDEVDAKDIFPAESLFVSTNGEGSHTYAYVSRFEFCANSDVSILIPKGNMSIQEKLFYAQCITLNRWKFSYGRKPKGLRLNSIELPADVPEWVATLDVTDYIADLNEKLTVVEKTSTQNKKRSSANKENLTTVESLFDVIYGTNLELVSLERDLSGINFVSRTSKNNGISAKVKPIEGLEPIQGPVLTVAGGGSVLETFLQKEPFYSGRDLFYLRPKRTMTDEELLFYCACIRANRFRYSYGRQANRTLKELLIPNLDALPNWIDGSLKVVSQECKRLISL